MASAQDFIPVYKNLIIACCNNRDYVDGYRLLSVCNVFFH